MRTVEVAELKKRLGKYLAFIKAGEEVVIRDGEVVVAKLIPFSAQGCDEQELALVAAGMMRLPLARLDLKALRKIPAPKVAGNIATRAILADREGW